MGGVTTVAREALYVEHEGSLAVVYNVAAGAEAAVAEAARGIIDEIVSAGPVVVIVDPARASVYVLERSKLAPATEGGER